MSARRIASGVTIRGMTSHDVTAALRLWNSTPGVSTADTPAVIRRFLRRNPGASFVARRGGRLVGAVLGGHDGRRGSLWHLAVARSERRRGLGKTLAGRVVAALRRAGVVKINILVLRTNAGGRRFWKSQGWEDVPAGVMTIRL